MVGEVEAVLANKNSSVREGAPKNVPLNANAFLWRWADLLLLHLAQLLLTLGQALTAAGTWLYNLTPKGYRQPPRINWDHDNPNWSDGFYIALGRQEWERRRRR